MKISKNKIKKGMTLIEVSLIIGASLMVSAAGLQLINSQSQVQAQLHKLDVAERSLLCVDNFLRSISTDWNNVEIVPTSSGHIRVIFTQLNDQDNTTPSTNQIVLYSVDIMKGTTSFKQLRAQILNQADTQLMDVEITEPVYQSITPSIDGPLFTISTADYWGGSTVSRIPINN